MRSVALIVVVLFTGCTMSKSSKSTVTMLGVATSVAGVALVAAGPDEVDSNMNGVNEWSLNDDYSKPFLGTLLLLTGLGIMLGGITANTPDDEDPRPFVMQPVRVVETTPAPAPTVAEPMVAAPGLTPSLAKPRAALPEVAVDDETLRLAKTMRHVASVGNCDAAAMLLDRILARSHAYYQALVAGPVLDPCPQLRPRTEFGSVE